MNFWWVNQNQTYRHEIEGGYIWSPKTKSNGNRNIYYDNLTKVRPGDIVFSFFGTKIPYLGIIKSHGYTHPKPDFGAVGDAWKTEGWMINVDYRILRNQIKPKDFIEEIRPLLPERYSPLQLNGKGNQGVYLTHIPEGLARKLLEIIGEDVRPALSESTEHIGDVKTDKAAEEERIEKLIKKNLEITVTEKETLVKARNGQGKFRDEVLALHMECPFTKVQNPQFLRAGHLKSWAKCNSNEERLDPLNGLPLTPVADHLIDQGFASFDDEGSAIFSPLLETDDLIAMGINPKKTYKIRIFNQRQLDYIRYHRNNIFKNNNV